MITAHKLCHHQEMILFLTKHQAWHCQKIYVKEACWNWQKWIWNYKKFSYFPISFLETSFSFLGKLFSRNLEKVGKFSSTKCNLNALILFFQIEKLRYFFFLKQIMILYLIYDLIALMSFRWEVWAC